jgi:hypothetical protein
MTKGRGGPQRGKEVLAMFGRRPMSTYHWEPHWACLVRLTEPDPASEPPAEPPVAHGTCALDAAQVTARNLFWRFKKIEGRMQSWQDRRGRQRRRR